MAKKTQITVKIMESANYDDYLVPNSMKISEVIELIIKIAFPTGHPILDRIGTLTLYDTDNKKVCPRDKTVEECGLVRGSSAIIM